MRLMPGMARSRSLMSAVSAVSAADAASAGRAAAAVDIPATLTVPMSTTSDSSHLSALRIHPPLESHGSLRKLSERFAYHQGYLVSAQHDITGRARGRSAENPARTDRFR